MKPAGHLDLSKRQGGEEADRSAGRTGLLLTVDGRGGTEITTPGYLPWPVCHIASMHTRVSVHIYVHIYALCATRSVRCTRAHTHLGMHTLPQAHICPVCYTMRSTCAHTSMHTHEHIQKFPSVCIHHVCYAHLRYTHANTHEH
jgi:hypothetical protein